MTFDALKDWPLFHTSIACVDGKFGILYALDDERERAVVSVYGERGHRYIPVSELEPGRQDTLVQLQMGATV
jgi:hypothetical protein